MTTATTQRAAHQELLQRKTKVSTLLPEETVQFYIIFCAIYVGLWQTRKHGELSASQPRYTHKGLAAPVATTVLQSKYTMIWLFRAIPVDAGH